MSFPVKWLEEPQEHDYPAAQDYLELLFSAEAASKLVAQLRMAAPERKMAKDLLRASGLPLLGFAANDHVAKDIRKIRRAERLSPVLLITRWASGLPPIIADGYHRVCAAHNLDEDVWVPCRMADLSHAYSETHGKALLR